MNPELVSTIAGMRRSGLTDARIREVLLSTGWAELEVVDALKSMPPSMNAQTFGEEPGQKPHNIAAAVLIVLIFALIGAAIVYGAYIGW